MPDLDQTIERIEEDLDQVEAAQQLVKEAAEQVSVLQKSAEGLVKRAETDFNAIVEKHQDLIGKLTQIAGKLEGFDFPDLKRDLQALDKQILKQGQLSQEGISALASLLNSLSADLGHMEESLQSRLESVRISLQRTIQDQWQEERQWMETRWASAADQVAQLQQSVGDFRKAQEKTQRRLQNWLIGLSTLAVILLGLMIYSLLRKPERLPEPVVQDSTGQAEEIPAQPENEAATVVTPPPAEVPVPELLSPAEARSVIESQASNALSRIKSQSFPRLAEKYWDPAGVTFFPFGLSSPGKKFTLDELKTLPAGSQIYQWGNGPDGSPVALSFADYFRQYVNHADFANASSVHYNEITQPGRSDLSAAGIARQFGPCVFVEYVAGEKSLVLVFGEETKQVMGVVSGG